MGAFVDQLKAHTPAQTKLDIDRAKGFAKGDWEPDFLHDLAHDVAAGKTISRDQRSRMEKILTRPSSVARAATRAAAREEESPCNYKGCEWTGTGSEWWAHAHEKHGRALPHWLESR